jgi:hypothetical protein
VLRTTLRRIHRRPQGIHDGESTTRSGAILCICPPRMVERTNSIGDSMGR